MRNAAAALAAASAAARSEKSLLLKSPPRRRPKAVTEAGDRGGEKKNGERNASFKHPLKLVMKVHFRVALSPDCRPSKRVPSRTAASFLFLSSEQQCQLPVRQRVSTPALKALPCLAFGEPASAESGVSAACKWHGLE